MTRGKRRRDPLLRALRGRLDLAGEAYEHGTERLIPIGRADLGALLRRCDFRTIVSASWPCEIGAVWSPSRGCALPIPGALLAHLAETVDGGRGVLLLCDDRATRDMAKVGLIALLGPSARGAAH